MKKLQATNIEYRLKYSIVKWTTFSHSAPAILDKQRLESPEGESVYPAELKISH